MPKLTLICEDRQQEAFFRHFLRKKGYDKREIYTEKAPKSIGSGEQFVREEYKKQVKLLRSKAFIKSIGLLVVIDADNKTVEDRHRQLDQALGANCRQSEERIYIATPKRNIETWIHYLSGNPVSEKENYPKLPDQEKECREAAVKLAEIIRDLPKDAPDSLKKSALEINRIFV